MIQETTEKKVRKKRRISIEAKMGWLFLAPALIMLCIWFIYPLIRAFTISFFDYNYMFPDLAKFVGLKNYINLFQDAEFYKALTHSLIFVLLVVPAQTFLSMFLAVLVNKKIKARGLFRTAFFLPYVLSSVAVATVFMYLFVKDTSITKFFALFGIPNVTWFASTTLSLIFIGIMYVWQTLGFYMIYYLSGLQTISASYYEAAEMDGATRNQIFWKITFPLLKPSTFFVMTYGTIQAFQLFDQISVVTSNNGGLGSPAGSTSTLLTYFYSNSFSYYKMGYGSSVAVIIFLIILIVSFAQRKLTKME